MACLCHLGSQHLLRASLYWPPLCVYNCFKLNSGEFDKLSDLKNKFASIFEC